MMTDSQTTPNTPDWQFADAIADAALAGGGNIMLHSSTARDMIAKAYRKMTNDPNATKDSGAQTSPPSASREEGASGAVAPDHEMAKLDAKSTLSNRHHRSCRHCNLARAYLDLIKTLEDAALEFERRMDEHSGSYNKHDFGDGQWLAYRNAAAWIHDASDTITGEGKQWRCA